MSYSLAAIANLLGRELEVAQESMEHLPDLAQKQEVVFKCFNNLAVPGFKRLDELIKDSAVGTLSGKVTATENMVQDFAASIAQLSHTANISLVSAYWRLVNLKSGTNDADLSQILFRARVGENAARFAFSAENVIQLDRKFSTDGEKHGNWLLPKFSKVAVALAETSSAPSVSAGATVLQNWGNSSTLNTGYFISTQKTVTIPQNTLSGIITSIRVVYNLTPTSTSGCKVKIFSVVSGNTLKLESEQAVTVTLTRGAQTITLPQPMQVSAGQRIGFYFATGVVAYTSTSGLGTLYQYTDATGTMTFVTHPHTVALYAQVFNTIESAGAGSPISAWLNAAGYPALTRDVQRTQIHYFQYRYGPYWWQTTTGSRFSTFTEKVSEPLTGSLIGQSFKVTTERVLIEVNIQCNAPGTYRSAANPRLHLCETTQGMPNLNAIIASSTLVDNANAASTENAPIPVTFLLNRPVLLRPDTQYAVILQTNGEFRVYHGNNHDPNGMMFFTQDGEFWVADLEKDLSYELIVARFESTTVEMELQHVSMEGGVGSLSYDKVAIEPTGTSVDFFVQLNEQWINIAALDALQQRPAYFPVKAVFQGTQDTFPIVDTVRSRLNVFRPDTSFRFISKPIPTPKPNLIVSYQLRGYEEDYHSFEPRMSVNGTLHQPAVLEIDKAGTVAKITAKFLNLPAGETRHDAIGSTLTPVKVFEIANIMEI